MTTLARPQRTIQPLVAGARGYRKHLGQYGAGGRSSVNDKSVAVFGATGFLGRFVTNRLGEFGANLLSAGSLDEFKAILSEMESIVQRIPFLARGTQDVHHGPDDEDSMRAAIGDADTVVNLIGKYYETKHICFTRKEDGSISRINSSFKNVNVDVPARLARAAKAAGVKNFVHVSALAQDPESPSMWAKTKAEGEVAVKAEFPEATIIRPAKLFGSDDRLLMWLSFLASKMGNIPLVNNGSHLIQPIDARNVAEVIMTVVDDPENVDYRGKVIELAGPGEFSWSETVDFVLDSTHLGPMTTLRDMDLEQAKMWGMLLEQLPDPMWTVDEAVQMTTDVVTKPNPDALTLDDFGVKPYKMEEAGIHLLMRFKRVQHFGLVKGYH